MRELFPIKPTEPFGLAGETKYVDQETFNELVNRVNTFIDSTNLSLDNIEDEISNFASVITTQVLHVSDNADIVSAEITNAIISSLEANEIVGESVDSERLRCTDFAQMKDLAVSGIINAIDAFFEGNITAKNISGTNVTASTKVSAPTIEATNANITNLNIENFTADDITADNVVANTKVSAPVIEATTADIETANITEANLATANVTDLVTDKIDVTNILHTINRQIPQVVDYNQHGDYYVKIPAVENGDYKIYAMNNDNTVLLWSLTFHFEKKDPVFYWHRNPDYGQGPFLTGVVMEDHITPWIMANTRGMSHNIYWANDSKDISTAPVIYDDLEATGEITYDYINENDGSYFTGLVNLELDKVPTEELTLSNVTDYTQASSSVVSFNGLQPEHYAAYKPDQDVNTTAKVTHVGIEIDAEDPEDIEGIVDKSLDASKYVMTDADKRLVSQNEATVTNGVLINNLGENEKDVVSTSKLAAWNGKTNGIVNVDYYFVLDDGNDTTWKSTDMQHHTELPSSAVDKGACYFESPVSHRYFGSFKDSGNYSTDKYIWGFDTRTGTTYWLKGPWPTEKTTRNVKNSQGEYVDVEGYWMEVDQMQSSGYTGDGSTLHLYVKEDVEANNHITKLGTVDEGTWNAGDVTANGKIEQTDGTNKHFYVGPTLTSIASFDNEALIIEYDE